MRISPWCHSFALVFLLGVSQALAKHGAPPPIQPVVHQGVRYVVPNDKGLRAYVEAWGVASGRKLWTRTIFRHWYVPCIESECMRYEYITSMVLEIDHLRLTSERGRDYGLDLRTRTIRRMKTKRPNAALGAPRSSS